MASASANISNLLKSIDLEIGNLKFPPRDLIPDPAPEALIAELCDRFDARFPPDLLAFYRQQDGEQCAARNNIFGVRNFQLLPIEEVLDALDSARSMMTEMPRMAVASGLWSSDSSVPAVGWHKHWMPLTNAPRDLVVEISPSSDNGRAFRQSHAKAKLTLLAQSFAELLEMQVANLREGNRNFSTNKG